MLLDSMNSGINPSTVNDFTRLVTPMGTFSNHAQLMIYSPKPMPNQVLRSHVYQFTPNFMDALINSKPDKSFERKISTHLPDINRVILPDSEGKIVDVSNWSNVWTFTLIYDLEQNSFAGIRAPSIRKIASGYFTDEPGTIDMGGNFILNPNCVLVFTCSTDITITKGFSERSAVDGLNVTPVTQEFAGQSIPTMYKENMYLGTPGDLLNAAVKSTNQGFNDYSNMDLSMAKAGQSQRKIDNELKSPKAQLQKIMSSIDNGIENTIANQPVISRMASPDEYLDPVQQSLNFIENSLPDSMYTGFHRGLDASRPITIAELDELFPNLEVRPMLIRTDVGYGWDVASQVGQNTAGQVGPIVSPKQQYSALAATSVQAICASLGLATVIFSYRWLNSDGFVAGKYEAFNISKFDFMVPRENQIIVDQYATRFKQYLDSQLFEVIHDNVGEFEIHAMCDMAGTVSVDLRLYNYPDPQDGAFFQTDSKLGGIINPLVGSINVINTNANQLFNTINNIAGVEFSDWMYNQTPVVPTI